MSKIMIVDDEPGIVVLVERILKVAGHEVIGATSGKEALEKLKKIRPDLILLDVMMPRLDGWQTLELIRKQDGLKDVPVSMLTAKTLTPEIMARKDLEELVNYVQKPFTKASLTEKVGEILEDLKSLDKRLSRLRSIVGDGETLDVYKLAVRSEMLHKNMLDTLNEILGIPGKDNNQTKEDLKASIQSQQQKIELFMKQRMKIEARAAEKDFDIDLEKR